MSMHYILNLVVKISNSYIISSNKRKENLQPGLHYDLITSTTMMVPRTPVTQAEQKNKMADFRLRLWSQQRVLT